MLTVSKPAQRCGLSRSTLLYYESIGLLRPAARSSGNYRRYGDADLKRLEQICAYRDAGLRLEDIAEILSGKGGGPAEVLERRFLELNGEIEKLRAHQRTILKLLQHKISPGRKTMVTKDKLVSVMRAAGLTEEDMRRFHMEFERSAPDDHQEFLEFLKISADEIRQIREWSRAS